MDATQLTTVLTPRTRCLLPVHPYGQDEVKQAEPERICFSSVLPEEDGRFYRARNACRIIETDLDPRDEPDGRRWLPVIEPG